MRSQFWPRLSGTRVNWSPVRLFGSIMTSSLIAFTLERRKHVQRGRGGVNGRWIGEYKTRRDKEVLVTGELTFPPRLPLELETIRSSSQRTRRSEA